MDDCFIEDYSFAHNDSGLFFLACSTMQAHAYVCADPTAHHPTIGTWNTPAFL